MWMKKPWLTVLSPPGTPVKTRTSWWVAGHGAASVAVRIVWFRFASVPSRVATAALGANGRSKQYRPSPSWTTLLTFLLAKTAPLDATLAQARICWLWSARLFAALALFALFALFALATESPGALAVIWLSAWFFAMFLTFFLSFLLSALIVATLATPVPASAKTRAIIETIIAGDGRLPLNFSLIDSSYGCGGPSPPSGVILRQREDAGQGGRRIGVERTATGPRAATSSSAARRRAARARPPRARGPRARRARSAPPPPP